MEYADWKALHDGYDAQRTVMYRKILLEDGNLLEFFKTIYFFVESLAIIGGVPAAYLDGRGGTGSNGKQNYFLGFVTAARGPPG